MKICAISDTHRTRPSLPKADLLIHAGDLLSRGDSRELYHELKWLKQIRPAFAKGIIFVPGNHDRIFDEGCTKWRKQNLFDDVETEEVFKDFERHEIKVLNDEACEIDGLKFYGSPYTPTFYDWAFMDDEDGLLKRFKKIPDDTQILITHGPAEGVLDLVDWKHAGSSSLRYEIDTRLKNLKAHICGHIHEGAGIRHGTYDRYLKWNASVLDGNYRAFNEIYVWDTESNDLTATRPVDSRWL